MDETYNLTGIILNRRAFSEDDGRVCLYTRERGKLDLTVRGMKKIKSKLAGHLEPLTLSQIMAVRGRQYDYVGAAVSQRCHSRLKADLDKLAAAGQAISVFNKLVKEGQADERLFLLLEEFLNLLDNYELRTCLPDRQVTNYELYLDTFIFKLLTELGYKPELDNCLGCGKKISPGRNIFDFAKGGLLCANCSVMPNKQLILAISDDAIKLLRLAVKCGLEGLIKIKVGDRLEKEIKNIINCFFQYHQT